MLPAPPRQHYPATLRNREPILGALESVLADLDTSLPVVEIASGTGEHCVYFASQLPSLLFQPTEPDPGLRESIAAYRDDAALTNLLAPIALDVERLPWPVSRAAAIVCINMIHIAPFTACEALFDGASRCLAHGAPIYLYGPFRLNGAHTAESYSPVSGMEVRRHTAESNATFDASLRARDARWGVRDLEVVTACASARGFELARVEQMPANNLSVVFVKA